VEWAIGEGQEHGDDPSWDRADAEALYRVLEDEIIPESTCTSAASNRGRCEGSRNPPAETAGLRLPRRPSRRATLVDQGAVRVHQEETVSVPLGGLEHASSAVPVGEGRKPAGLSDRSAKARSMASSTASSIGRGCDRAARLVYGTRTARGAFMTRRDPDERGRARVIGSLTGDALQLLVDALQGGVAVLDLSEVDQVDHHAVRGRCRP
jgi:hypothetical protein